VLPNPVLIIDTLPAPAAPRGTVDVRESQKLATAEKNGVVVSYSCRTACDMAATLTISFSTARKLKLSRTLAKATQHAAANAKATATLRLSKATAKRLKNVKRLAATVTIVLSNENFSEHFDTDVTMRR
jgi:hypothetical protein